MLANYNEHYVETPHYWIAARAAVASSEALGFPITLANSMVYGDPDDPADPSELLREAQLAEDLAPKCEYCGTADDVETWTWYDGPYPDDEVVACSENHAELAMERRYPYVGLSGMPGYMPNQVYRFCDWSEARRWAVDEARRWQDQDLDEEQDWSVSYSNDAEYFTYEQGYETIDAYKA
jgi:hypothetical protein